MKEFDNFLNGNNFNNLKQLFEVNMQVVDEDGIIYLKKERKNLKAVLSDLKKQKNEEIEGGNVGDSLYIEVLKNNKVEFLIRCSYHEPRYSFGTQNRYRDTIAFLCIDMLNDEDNEKAYQMKKERFQSQLNATGLKDKEEHKRIVTKKLKLSNLTFVDLGNDYPNKVFDCIKEFLETYSKIIENNSYNDYSLIYEITNED